MQNKLFEKEHFKNEVRNNVKTLYRRTLDEATPQQVFQAVSYAVKDVIIDNWLKSQEVFKKEDPKTVYYMSMEFLMGRALGNNLINLTAYQEVKEALDELGFDLNVIEDQEPDAALGNGGLGRLAACFLDSLATLGYCAYGCGIRYRYGMFKQEIRDGFQVEVPDNWLKDGNPFELRRPEYAKEVKFGGYVRAEYDHATGRTHFIQEGYFERHLNRMRRIYGRKHDILLGELKKLSGSVRVTGEHAGVHLLVEFQNGMTEAEVIRRAEEQRVRVYPLSEYTIDGSGEKMRNPAVLLGYATLTEEELLEAAGSPAQADNIIRQAAARAAAFQIEFNFIGYLFLQNNGKWVWQK